MRAFQQKGIQAIPGAALSRSDREALQRAGFLKDVIRGWYIPSRPDEAEGDTTPWYASMREFVAGYSNERFKDRWHLNPEQSLLLRSGERSVPKQIQIWAAEGTNQTVQLPHGCSLFIYRPPELLPASPVQDAGGLRLAELPAALVAVSPTLFVRTPLAAQVALASLPDTSDILRLLLAGSGTNSSAAGRLAGAFRAIGRPALADDILAAMRGAGYTVNEVNPFEKPLRAQLPGGRPESPYVQRLRLMWAAMRTPVPFVDDSRLSAGPNSTLAINRFRFNQNTHAGTMDTTLKRGTLSVVSGKLAKQSPDAVTVRTPSTILGVRGTEFVVRAGE